MSIQIQLWQAVLVAVVGMPALSLGLGYLFFGGKRRLASDIETQTKTSDAALITAASSGFEKAMSSSSDILGNYLRLIEEVAVLKADFETMKRRVEQLESDGHDKDRRLLEAAREKRMIARIATTSMRENTEKQNVIDSLFLLISAAGDGKEPVEGTIAKSKQILAEWTDTYGRKNPAEEAKNVGFVKSVLLETEVDEMIRDTHNHVPEEEA